MGGGGLYFIHLIFILIILFLGEKKTLMVLFTFIFALIALVSVNALVHFNILNVDLSDVLIFEQNGATYSITGLVEVDETNEPGFWVVNPENPAFPDLANPDYYINPKCICLNHPPNSASHTPPAPWRSDVIGVVYIDGLGYRLAFSSDITTTTITTTTTTFQEARLFPLHLVQSGSSYNHHPPTHPFSFYTLNIIFVCDGSNFLKDRLVCCVYTYVVYVVCGGRDDWGEVGGKAIRCCA